MDEPLKAAAEFLAALREGIPNYDKLQDELVKATTGIQVRTILDLGAGTGETSRRLLAAHPYTTAVGIDPSEDALRSAAAVLGDRAQLRLAALFEPLPHGPFDVIVSALSLHALRPADRTRLLQRAHRALSPGGRIVIADAITPGIELPGRPTPGDREPDRLELLVQRFYDAALEPRVVWSQEDLAVIAAVTR